MTKIILIFLILAWGWTADWEQTVDVFDEGRAYYQKTFLDQGTWIFHVLALEFIDSRWNLRQKKIKQGNVGKAINLMPEYSCQISKDSVDMFGFHNGKDFFVVGICKGSYYHDVQFVESHDGGNTWSKPVVARKTEGDKYFEYSHPQIIAYPSGKVDIFYVKKNYGIQSVTREAGSKEWSEEIPFHSKICKSVSIHRKLVVIQASKEDGLIMGYVCSDTNAIVLAESKDQAHWKEYAFQPVIKEENDEAPRFTITHNKETNRVFLSVGINIKNNGMNWLFEYEKGGTFHKLYSEPFPFVMQVSLGAYIKSGILRVISLFQLSRYDSKGGAKSFNLNPDKPWEIQDFPLPILGTSNYQIEFHYLNSYLYAFGKSNNQVVAYRRIKI